MSRYRTKRFNNSFKYR